MLGFLANQKLTFQVQVTTIESEARFNKNGGKYKNYQCIENKKAEPLQNDKEGKANENHVQSDKCQKQSNDAKENKWHNTDDTM